MAKRQSKKSMQKSKDKPQLSEKELSAIREVLPNLDKGASSDQILEGLASKLNSNIFFQRLRENQEDMQYARFKAALAFASVYTKVSNVRLEMIREVDKMRTFYLVDVILSQMTEDALTPEIGTGDILSITSEKKEIQSELDLLDEKFGFDQLALSILPDLLAYGEYILSTEIRAVDSVKKNADENPSSDMPTIENKNEDKSSVGKLHERQRARFQGNINEQEDSDLDFGLVNVMDIVEQGTVVALSKDGVIEGYLVRNERGGVSKAEPADFIRFSLDSQRIRVDLATEFQVNSKSIKRIFKDIPRFLRVGKSCIWPVLGKLKELQLLESLVPATKINKLTTGSIVGVNVPAGYQIDQALDAAKRVEGVLNKKVGIDQDLGEVNIENIMSAAGKIKVVPVFGDKGQLEKIDFKSDEPDELLSSIEDIRRVILSSVGIPFELVFYSEGDSKGEILKRYARYLRKLKNIQRAVQDGIKQMIYIHLANKDIDFEPEDVDVEFRNKLVEIDNLDKLEFMDTVVGMVNNLKQFVFELAEEDSPLKEAIKLKPFVEWMNEQFNVIGLGDVIDAKSFKEPSDFEQDPDGNFIDPERDPQEPPEDNGQENTTPQQPVTIQPPGFDNN